MFCTEKTNFPFFVQKNGQMKRARSEGDDQDYPPTKNSHTDSADGYSDVHKAVLQTLLNERVVPELTLRKVAAVMTPGEPTPDLDTIVDKINKKLNSNSIGLEVRREGYEKAPDEEGPDEYYFGLKQVFFNEKNEKDCFTEAFFLENCEYLKKTEVETLKLVLLEFKKKFGRNRKGAFSYYFTKEELTTKLCAAALLKKFVGLKWLREVKVESRTLYFLGTRAMAEFKSFFFEDGEKSGFVPECTICRDITFFGLVCPNHRCSAVLHKKCARSYLRNMTVKKCPHCSESWEDIKTDGTGPIDVSLNADGNERDDDDDNDNDNSEDNNDGGDDNEEGKSNKSSDEE